MLALLFSGCALFVTPPEKTVCSELSARVSAENYQFILLGDLHYDNREHHTSAMLEKRKREIERNLSHWQKNAPGIVNAAKSKITRNTLFAVQLGDITQGDAKSQEDQKALFTEALVNIAEPMREKSLPFFVVKGNHDFRSPGKGDAFESVMTPFIQSQLPAGSEITGSNYAFRHGKDLFMFVDCQNPDVEFMKRILESNKDVRHLFVLDHLPVLPYGAGGSKWILFGERQGKLQEFRSEFRRLLASRNGIVLTGHVHDNSLSQYVNGGSITQITVSSMEFSNGDYPPVKDGFSEGELKKNRKSDDEFLDEFIPFMKLYKRTFGGGYAVVKVKGNAVEIEYFHGIADTASFSWKLK